jgi:RND family efflux transporter MFP subunit
MKKRIAIAVAVLLVIAAGVTAFVLLEGNGTGTQGLTGSGTIEAPEVAVAPLVSGTIVEAPATEGALVKKGDVLFRIDDSVIKLQVAQAQAGVNAATATRDQAKKDKKKASEIAVAQAQLDQATAALQLAQLQLSYCTVTAPTAGVVLTKALDAGENATPGKTLATIGRPSELTVTVYVPESQIGQVKVGQKAKLSTDSSSSTFDCSVTSVASEAEFTPAQVETKDQRVKLVYAVTLSVTDASGTLKPGMPADVVFE